ncbi:type II toxin-antitoxin system RelE/ParE family toxin [Mesorhizobium sp. LHD-90]|uniref:type II toxin-antitoxin system RelE/ParE family toxin n=1 Tax=Mesorhizobium sp. LHD-90 TaxID=3071414 RepID=UPI0027E2158B|nr:type II toxin-antitoxin system RelE/ParE family toxin [Mesorhizobium sp. LHD-90]MDQ6437275.1 type II toxin-antitoxin system RelE/ParE family toxin [Mesorhizobium sp. LHD-90]
MRVRYTKPADKDILQALSNSIRLFGPKQSERYLAVIRAGVQSIAEEPHRPASKARDELGQGVRSFHLQFAVQRQGGASHVIYYRVSSTGQDELIVLRVLADRMDPARRVRTALKTAAGQ